MPNNEYNNNTLTRDDLVLLMESYRNMITMHQTILDQSSKAIEKLDGIAMRQDSILTKQGTVCNSLTKITGRLDECASSLKESNSNIDTLEQRMISKLSSHSEKSIEVHEKIINKIHFGWIGMGTIIIGLIGLLYTLSTLINTLHPALK